MIVRELSFQMSSFSSSLKHRPSEATCRVVGVTLQGYETVPGQECDGRKQQLQRRAREKEQPGGNEHRRVCLYEGSISVWYITTEYIEVPSRCVLVHSIASSRETPAGRSRWRFRWRAQWPGSIARSQGRCGWKEAGRCSAYGSKNFGNLRGK